MSLQKKTDPRLWWLLGAAAVASLLWLGATFGLIGSAMDAQERQAVLQTVGDHEALEQEGIALSMWRIHRRIGMSGGLMANILLRESGVLSQPAEAGNGSVATDQAAAPIAGTPAAPLGLTALGSGILGVAIGLTGGRLVRRRHSAADRVVLSG